MPKRQSSSVKPCLGPGYFWFQLKAARCRRACWCWPGLGSMSMLTLYATRWDWSIVEMAKYCKNNRRIWSHWLPFPYFSYRISFHCSLLSVRDRRKIQSLKNQADWLLHNIIPRHVSESLKKSAQYSENHHEVGIIFASLVRSLMF